MRTDVTLTSVWRETLVAAHRVLTDVVSGIRDDQWHLPTPCSEWDVTQVIQHAAGDQLAYAKFLGIGNGPAENPFAPSGRIDGSPTALVRDAIEQTAAAWATVAEHTPTVPTPLPHGELPTPVAAVLCALDAAVHAWDLAVATGQASPLDEKLAGALLTAARTANPAPGGGPETEIVEPLRQWGAYAAVVDGAPDDDAVAELLRYLGRDLGTVSRVRSS
ncbi:TIGR03086 family metal-binding protein [Nocardia amikacinitolerans]|uniref:TIGR03086 family metal-binding protein n=1 Tax=Nocardia amikacinitolerans TaxID=756689 RepID=UPI0020A61B56|nr:TIGR03086 family metal-binding protein [Nocardia amikacinitolerans]MCP2290229.1 TIGR03086 family protein [Nocardia amikacinitolerans]